MLSLMKIAGTELIISDRKRKRPRLFHGHTIIEVLRKCLIFKAHVSSYPTVKAGEETVVIETSEKYLKW